MRENKNKNKKENEGQKSFDGKKTKRKKSPKDISEDNKEIVKNKRRKIDDSFWNIFDSDGEELNCKDSKSEDLNNEDSNSNESNEEEEKEKIDSSHSSLSHDDNIKFNQEEYSQKLYKKVVKKYCFKKDIIFDEITEKLKDNSLSTKEIIDLNIVLDYLNDLT